MRTSAAEVQVCYRRPVSAPAWNGTSIGELVQAQAPVEDVAFVQGELPFQIKGAQGVVRKDGGRKATRSIGNRPSSMSAVAIDNFENGVLDESPLEFRIRPSTKLWIHIIWDLGSKKGIQSK